MTSIGPAPYLIALSSRFETARVERAGAAAYDRRRVLVQRQLPVGAQARRVDGRAGELGERDRLDRLLVGVGIAREGHQLGDEVGELVHLEADAVGHLAALVVGEPLGAGEELGVGLQARQRACAARGSRRR